jgi:hypothetical protein
MPTERIASLYNELKPRFRRAGQSFFGPANMGAGQGGVFYPDNIDAPLRPCYRHGNGWEKSP